MIQQESAIPVCKQTDIIILKKEHNSKQKAFTTNNSLRESRIDVL